MGFVSDPNKILKKREYEKELEDTRAAISDLLNKGTPSTVVPPPITATNAAPKTVLEPPVRVAPPESTGRVRMKSPDGRTGTLPANQVEEAISKGWTRL